MLAAGITIAALALVLTLWPRESVAAALTRMDNAITNVTAMEAKTYRTRLGKTRLISKCSYLNGSWRYDNFIGTPLEATWIIGDERLIHHVSAFPYTTVGKPFGYESVPPKSALEYVKSEIDAGNVGVERQMELVRSGRNTYTIVATRPGYRAEIVVDAETDLPISAEMSVDYGGGQRDNLSWEFAWDGTLDESDFKAESLDAPIVDRDHQVIALRNAWSKPIAVSQIAGKTSRLRNVFVARDGTVFLAYTHHADKSGTAPVPFKITDDAGNEYLRTTEYSPGGVFGEVPTREDLALDGGEMRIAAFAPLDTDTPAGHFDIHWTLSRSTWPGTSEKDLEVQDKGATTTVSAPRRSDDEFPSYSAALIIDYYHVQKRTEIARLRARAHLDLERYREAIAWAWAAYDSYKHFIARIAYRELPLIVDAHRALGEEADATAVQERYDKEKALDESYRGG